MKAITTLLFIASVALNACFFAGCKSLHDFAFGNPCKYASPPPTGKEELVKIAEKMEELVKIAEKMEIKTFGKTASDLSSAICSKLDSKKDAPTVFDSAAFEKMAKDLNSSEETAMREYHNFISGLQGKRIIVIGPED